MMSKLLITTHWTAEEAEVILAFLNELQGIITTAYEVELAKQEWPWNPDQDVAEDEPPF